MFTKSDVIRIVQSEVSIIGKQPEELTNNELLNIFSNSIYKALEEYKRDERRSLQNEMRSQGLR